MGRQKSVQDLPEHLRVQHEYVVCTEDANSYPATTTSAGAYMSSGVDNGWSHAGFEAALRVVVVAHTEEGLEFEVAGVDPAVANALRRIMISDLETMAVEHVFVVNNTSVVQDEALAHRLGLVPIAIDPDLFEGKAAAEASTEKNSLVYRLSAVCRRVAGSGGDAMEGTHVVSGQLQWLPGGSRLPDETNCLYAGSQAGSLQSSPALVHDDILLAKMRPGQVIELEAHCSKGSGREHAKWSPVATAWYRLYPEVALLRDVAGPHAQQLHEACPEIFQLVQRGGGQTLQVAPIRTQEQLLEKVRRIVSEEQWADSVQLRKRKHHFIFTVEPTGQLPAREIVTRSLQVLASKCEQLLQTL